MAIRWNLGNDIVDLTDPRHSGKAGDERFLERVFSAAERKAIQSSSNPDRALWIRWAGKEAGFKTVSKALGTPPVFIHSRFRVTVFRCETQGLAAGGLPDPPMTRFGQVRYEDLLLPLRIEVAGPALHAVTYSPHGAGGAPPLSWGFSEITGRDGSWRETLEKEFSPLEWNCISHQASALARRAARHSMASVLQVDEAHLEIGCGPGKPGRRIPRVFLDGEEALVDLSLSHHGRLLAWAFLTPPRR